MQVRRQKNSAAVEFDNQDMVVGEIVRSMRLKWRYPLTVRLAATLA